MFPPIEENVQRKIDLTDAISEFRNVVENVKFEKKEGMEMKVSWIPKKNLPTWLPKNKFMNEKKKRKRVISHIPLNNNQSTTNRSLQQNHKPTNSSISAPTLHQNPKSKKEKKEISGMDGKEEKKEEK